MCGTIDRSVADVLIEALPYIRRFSGGTIVIKYGGHAMVDEQLKEDFARDVALLKLIGMNPVVVHGGGPQIGAVLEKMNIQSRFVDGIRVTDKPIMDVVEMVLMGKVNKEIVSQINRHGGKAVGLSGKDSSLIVAEKLQHYRPLSDGSPTELVDMGMVGKVTAVNADIIGTLESGGFIPVIAPVGVGVSGESYNINADLVASQVAIALNAIKLILLTDVPGVLGRDKKLIPSITAAKAREMLANGTITGGMIPKTNCAIEAMEQGVGRVHIIDGRKPHAVLLELFTDPGVGTEFIP